MKILSLVLLISLFGCGDDIIINPIVEDVKRPVFSGYFTLNGPSAANCIYLDEKIANVVDIETDCQSLVTINPQNGTIGQFPNISRSNVIVLNNEIKFTQNINYTAGNDLEEDVSGANVVGSKRTDLRFFFDRNDKLKVEIKVYKAQNNNNLNEIVIDRSFKEVN